MDAIKYLKLDLRVSKGNMKIIPIFIGIIILLINKIPTMGNWYLLFMLIAFAGMPFDSSISEKSNKMYLMFPSKVSSMVLGRFLYLIMATLIIFGIDGVIIEYLYKVNLISINEVIVTLMSGIVTLGVCFFQYPIYYKFGLEKGRILSIIVYLAPAFIVFMIPDILKENIVTKNINDGGVFIFLIVSLLITIFIGYISYLISYKICTHKEL